VSGPSAAALRQLAAAAERLGAVALAAGDWIGSERHDRRAVDLALAAEALSGARERCAVFDRFIREMLAPAIAPKGLRPEEEG